MKPSYLLLALLAGLPGCKRETPPHEDSHAPEEGAEAEAHAGGKGEAQVRIAPEMLRDLRVTTAPVEARSGDESVTVLGELTFSENAYAEVASPIPARVSSVAATTGQQVKEGQRLVDLQSPELGKARAALQAAQARATAARQAAERKR